MNDCARVATAIRHDWGLVPVAVLIVCFAVLLPFVLVPALPLFDVPNHLARLYALGDVAGSPIRLSFVPHWALMPNLGVDLIYEAMKFVASPEVVIRVCLVGSLVLLLAAMWRMQRLFWGTASYSMVAAPVFVTGLCVYMGYLNYILSISIVFAGLAVYVGWRDHLSVVRIGALAVFATAAWIAHIAGFCVFLLLLGAIDLTARWTDVYIAPRPAAVWRARLKCSGRTLALMAAVFGPAAVLSLFAERQMPQSHFHYAGLEKARFLIAPALLTNGSADMAVLVFGLVLLIFVVFGRAFVLPRIVRPAVVLLAGLIVVCPVEVGQAVDVDARLVMPLVALVLGCGRLALPASQVAPVGFFVCVMVVALFRSYAFAQLGIEDSRDIARFRFLAGDLPTGSAMLVADYSGTAGCAPPINRPAPPLDHLASFAAIDRGIYSATVFTGIGMQPLRSARPPFPASTAPVVPVSVKLLQAVTHSGSLSVFRADVTHDEMLRHELAKLRETGGMPLSSYWPEAYQSLLVLHDGCGMNPLPDRLDMVGSGDSFSVFRVRG